MSFFWLVVIKGVLDIVDRLIDHEGDKIPSNIKDSYQQFAQAVRDSEVA